MVQIVFYEKPGCINNTRQKKRLVDAGHVLDVRNLLATAWTIDTLRPYFEGLAVNEWFNKSAPAVKSGEVHPDAMDAEAALASMVQDPLLIRRPLMVIDGRHYCGFDSKRLNDLLGLAQGGDSNDLENCPRSAT